MTNHTKITVPSVDEIAEIKQAFPADRYPLLSDFAVANGASFRPTNLKGGKVRYTGKIWTRNLSTTNPCAIVTHDFFCDAVHRDQGQAAASEDIAIMPRFQNPEADGFGLTQFDGQSVLTIRGKIAAQPFRNVGPARERELRQTALHQTPLGQCRTRVRDDLGRYQVATSPAFGNDGKIYAYQRLAKPTLAQCAEFANGVRCQENAAYWYEYRPVRAMRCQDGSIQCLDQFAPCRFAANDKFNDQFNSRRFVPGQELDTDLFEIGRYLNREIKQDLLRSTKFGNYQTAQKLTKAPTFAKHALKETEEEFVLEPWPFFVPGW